MDWIGVCEAIELKDLPRAWMVKKLGKGSEKEGKERGKELGEPKLERRARKSFWWEDRTKTTTVAADRHGLWVRRIYRDEWFSWFALHGF